MVRVSAGELQKHWGRVQDTAIGEPVTVTCNGRDRMVLLSAEEYNRLKRRDRHVMLPRDFSDEDIRQLENTTAPKEAHAFDHEV